MTAIIEDYVSFETAKLLKEKGFNETCYACYEYFSSSITTYSGWPFEYKGEPVHNSKNIIKCPTLQMTMKWLRKEHNVHVQIEYERHAGYNKYGYTSTLIFTDDLSQTYVTWKPSYEEAAEFAIKYYLENPT